MSDRPPPPVNDWLLPYVSRLELRAPDAIDLVVVHCTELPDMAMAREFGEKRLYESGTGNSGHFYIDRDGTTHRFVPVERIAHHVRGHNHHSIGIELVNRGRYPDWLDTRHQQMGEPYPPEQIGALKALLRDLAAALPSLWLIAGHEDLDREQVPATDNPDELVFRKRDPGVRFPWSTVLAGMPLQRTGDYPAVP